MPQIALKIKLICKTSKRPLLWFSAAFSGVALLFTCLIGRGIWGGLLGAVLPMLVYVAVALLTRLPLSRAALLGWAAGLLWCAAWGTIVYTPALKLIGFTGTVTVRVESYAAGYESYGVMTGTLLEADGKAVKHKVKVYLQDGSPDYSPGNILRFTARLTGANGELRRGNLQNGVFLQLTQQGPIIYEGDKPTPVNRAAILSRGLSLQIHRLLEGDEAAMLAALLTGDTGGFSLPFRRALSVSGSAHITSISGMHVSILVGLLIALLGKRAGLYAAVPIMLCYAAIAGLVPSVLRSVIMCGFTVAAFALRREGDTLTALFAALLMLVAWNPFSILSPGLLLSFSATLGLVLFTPMLTSFFNRFQPPRLGGLYRQITGSLATSIAAVAPTLPLCVLLFDSVSLSSALTTLLVLWAVSLSMALGLGILLISAYFPPLAAFLARYVLYWPLTWMVRIIRWVGDQPWAALSSGNLYLVIACLTLLAAVVAAFRGRLRAFGGIALGVCAFCACFGLTAVEQRLYGEIAIEGAEGEPTILLRAGDQAFAIGASPRFMENTLLQWSIAGIDQMLLTGGKEAGVLRAGEVARRLDVGQLLTPGQVGASSLGDSLLHLWYNEEGAIAFGPFTIELIEAGQGYASRIVAPDFSLLSLSGIEPLDALAVVNQPADLLVLDSRWHSAPHTLKKICALVRPRLIYYCDSGFGQEWLTAPVPVLYAGEAGVLSVQVRARSGA